MATTEEESTEHTLEGCHFLRIAVVLEEFCLAESCASWASQALLQPRPERGSARCSCPGGFRSSSCFPPGAMMPPKILGSGHGILMFRRELVVLGEGGCGEPARAGEELGARGEPRGRGRGWRSGAADGAAPRGPAVVLPPLPLLLLCADRARLSRSLCTLVCNSLCSVWSVSVLWEGCTSFLGRCCRRRQL